MNTWSIVSKDGEVESACVALENGDVLTAVPTHPNWLNILNTLRNATIEAEDLSTETLEDLFDAQAAINRKFTRLTERVMIVGGNLHFDGDLMDTNLAAAILRFHYEGVDDFTALVAFLEKLMTNPDPRAREHLFGWLARGRFGIAWDGDFIAYKGVSHMPEDGTSSAKFFSTQSGDAIVQGEWKNGLIPNEPGTIVEMPRSLVDPDPYAACHTGLHVANYLFARGFASRVVKVKVNPRDVVSVPDVTTEKLRVCRYYVIGEVQQEDTDLLQLDRTWTKRAEKYVKPEPVKPMVESDSFDVEDMDSEAWLATGTVKPEGELVDLNTQGNDLTADNTQKVEREVDSEVGIPTGHTSALLLGRQHPELTFPDFYEQFKRRHWRALTTDELQAVNALWELGLPENASKEKLTLACHAEATRRLQQWQQ